MNLNFYPDWDVMEIVRVRDLYVLESTVGIESTVEITAHERLKTNQKLLSRAYKIKPDRLY